MCVCVHVCACVHVCVCMCVCVCVWGGGGSECIEIHKPLDHNFLESNSSRNRAGSLRNNWELAFHNDCGSPVLLKEVKFRDVREHERD